jgi:hypothetical protein
MSDQSRRKLLKSIAAGSGAIVAGKNQPEKWIDNIYLINDANAVIGMGTINLTSFTGNASGTFTYQSIIDNFTFGAGLCGPSLADCCQDF